MQAMPNIPISPPTSLDAYIGFRRQLEKDFYSFKIDHWSKQLISIKRNAIMAIGEKRALSIFHEAAERIPAYKDFLNQHHIKHREIRDIEDFVQVPPIDKESYIQRYPLDWLVWDGRLERYNTVAVSSGSSGHALNWPRDEIMEYESNYLHELILNNLLSLNQSPTLVVVGFAMGMYTAGLLTTTSIQAVSRKGYPLLLVTPGLNLEDMICACQGIMGYVQNLVVFAYPTWITKFLDAIATQKNVWNKLRVCFIPAGEPFTEKWRDKTSNSIRQLGAVPSIYSVYGCSEKAILGHETPITLQVRKNLFNYPSIYRDLLRCQTVPNIYQYHPCYRYFESHDGHLLITATGGIPLIRYDIKDIGAPLKQDIEEQLIDSYKSEHLNWQLPLLYIRGRDSVLIFHGANIYPDNIEAALTNVPDRQSISGRFVMQLKESSQSRNKKLFIHLELSPNAKGSTDLVEKITNHIVMVLLNNNAEFKAILNAHGKSALPVVVLHHQNDSPLFSQTGKHKNIIQ